VELAKREAIFQFLILKICQTFLDEKNLTKFADIISVFDFTDFFLEKMLRENFKKIKSEQSSQKSYFMCFG
jgi:hypothetical protein